MTKETIKVKLPVTVYVIMVATIIANAISTYLIIAYLAQ